MDYEWGNLDTCILDFKWDLVFYDVPFKIRYITSSRCEFSRDQIRERPLDFEKRGLRNIDIDASLYGTSERPSSEIIQAIHGISMCVGDDNSINLPQPILRKPLHGRSLKVFAYIDDHGCCLAILA